jgi:alpha-aminoadipate carrier protein LysW
MGRVYCPDCDEKIVLNPDVELGLRFVCPNCDVELEVISVDPLEIDWAYDDSWDEDEEYDDEEDDDEEYDDDDDDDDEEDEDW